MWALSDIKLPLGIMEVVTGSPPFFIRRYMLRSVAFLAQHRAMKAKGQNVHPNLPTLRPYTHSQRIEITKLMHNHQTIFRQATDALQREDTTICFAGSQKTPVVDRASPRTINQNFSTSTQDLCFRNLGRTTDDHNERAIWRYQQRHYSPHISTDSIRINPQC